MSLIDVDGGDGGRGSGCDGLDVCLDGEVNNKGHKNEEERPGGLPEVRCASHCERGVFVRVSVR